MQTINAYDWVRIRKDYSDASDHLCHATTSTSHPMSHKHTCINNPVDILTFTLHPCTSINHLLRHAPSMSNCTIRVSITTHVIWYWHTGHAIMFSRHSVSQNHYIRSAYAGHVWEHVSFDIIGGTFVDGVWLCMTHPHA